MQAEARTWGAVWDYMPGTLRARELCQAYVDLEKLYWKHARYSVYALFSRVAKCELRNIKMRVMEKKSNIRWLGGRVPPLWSL